MKICSLVVLVALALTLTACNGAGSGGNTAKGSCLTFLKQLR